MNLTSISNLHDIRALESEFIPPLGFRDTWSMPWERHLSVTRAWQEAGGNRDGEACQWPAGVATTGAYPLFERRKRALKIDFPDRRIAA